MNTKARIAAGAAALVVLAGIGILFGSCKRIDPGYVGIIVNLTGTDRGIEIVPGGRTWYNPISQVVYEFPTFVQTAKWTRSTDEGRSVNEEISFNSKEGLIITADVSLSYQLDPSKIAQFYVKFRKGDLADFTDGYLRNITRDEFNAIASRFALEDIYGPRKAQFLEEVRAAVNAEVAPIGVGIEQFGFIGKPRLPESVEQAINAKITATQNAMTAENELRITRADSAKRVVAAEGEAQANLVVAQSITANLIEWRRLDIMSRWDGKLPQVQAGTGSGMILQLAQPQ